MLKFNLSLSDKTEKQKCFRTDPSSVWDLVTHWQAKGVLKIDILDI